MRADKQGDSQRLVGYAAVFNQWSDNLGVFYEVREKIAPGAFAETLEADDQRALWNHNPDYVLARKSAKTLELREDNTGLWIEVTPPATSWARDLMVSIDRGDVNQMSFQFEVLQDTFTYDRERDIIYRTLEKVKLFEVSPVTFPAYPQTSVNVRAAGDELAARAEAFRKQARDGQAPIAENGQELDLMQRRLRIAEVEI